MANIYFRGEYKGGENDKENLLQQIAKVNALSNELYEAVRHLSFSPVSVKMEEAPSEGKSDEDSKN